MAEVLSNKENLKKQVKANEGRDWGIYDGLMDVALDSKARSIFPHFGAIEEGMVIVDAGSGTGSLAERAASEFRGVHVFAEDVSHELMERASDNKALSNIIFGDASEQVFPAESVDVKYFSTSGHEIESFGGKGRMAMAVANTLKELKAGGRIIIRDFVKPDGDQPVYMQLPESDGVERIEEATTDGVIDYNRLSTKALFERFHEEFHGGNAFDYEVVAIDGRELVRLLPEWAYEFYMRKDYTGNWRQEIHEKYSYWTMKQARRVLTQAGFTDVKVLPDPNEYILKNRLQGKVALFSMVDDELQQVDFPPTHMVVVGVKSKDNPTTAPGSHIEDLAVNYPALKDTIRFDPDSQTVAVGGNVFKVDKAPIGGSKKTVYFLANEPRVLKVVRIDALNDHGVFKAMYQSIEREDLLDEFGIPHLHITSVDPNGPPYRYFIQDRIPQGSVCAADLIRDGNLTETDIQQMSSYINRFEIQKKWQLDTNPFNWYRVNKNDGTSEMVYVDGKVYRYDEAWEFKKIGLLQWIDPFYINGNQTHTARIPRVSDNEKVRDQWPLDTREPVLWWKKYLNSSIQP